MDIIAPAAGRPYAMLLASGEAGVLDVAPDQIMALYKAHGALLLRGFAVDLVALQGLTSQLCSGSVFNESPDRQVLDAASNIQSVNGGMAPFPLHPELSREPWKPDVCFFACLVPPREKGATTLCDGVALVQQLPEAVRQGFAGRRLCYLQAAPAEILQFWLGTTTPTDAELATPPANCPYSFVRIGGQIGRMFTRPALHRPMFTDAPAFGNFLLFSYYFNGVRGFPTFENGQLVPDAWLDVVKTTGDSLSAAIHWQQGDLLIIDNSRFMHGRTEVIENDDRLIASFFGYLKDAPSNPEEPVGAPWRQSVFRPPQRRAQA